MRYCVIYRITKNLSGNIKIDRRMLLATGTLHVLSFIVLVKPLISLISPEEFAPNKVYYIVNDRNIEQDL